MTFDEYVKELNLQNLSNEDQLDALYKVSKGIHTKFLMELSKELEAEKLEAIKTSIRLGPELYVTTLKHLIPNYLTIFEKCKTDVFSELKKV